MVVEPVLRCDLIQFSRLRFSSVIGLKLQFSRCQQSKLGFRDWGFVRVLITVCCDWEFPSCVRIISVGEEVF